MNSDELRRSGLLDQYVLGLLDPERSDEVAALIEDDPELQREVRDLRRELGSYADSRDIAPPPGGRPPRSAREFQDLDHEMITAMMERNHSLNIWRYLLLGLCLLLIGLAGYLFRLKEVYRHQLITARAESAQTQTDYQQRLERSRATGVVRLVEQSLDGGIITVEVPEAGPVVADLSYVDPLPNEEVYIFYGLGPAGDTIRTASVRGSDWPSDNRVPLPTANELGNELHIYRGQGDNPATFDDTRRRVARLYLHSE